MLHTNPVVVRRTMAALRDAGYVISIGGRGGGWSLTEEFSQLTVADIYRAIGPSAVFAFGPADDNPSCPVEAASNKFLLEAMASAAQLLDKQFMNRKLMDLANDLG
jgi:DNA-binding IscR family transcriptional regulator